MPLWVAGVQINCLAILGDSSIYVSSMIQNKTESVGRVRILGFEAGRLTVLLDGAAQLTLFFEHKAEVVVCSGVVRLDVQRLAKL